MELTPQQLSAETASGKFRPVYYLFGEDASARATAVEALKTALAPDAFNLNEFHGEAAADAVSAALTPPMFSARRLVIVKSAALRAEAKKALAEYLADPLLSTTLVLHCEERKPDVRDVLAAAAAAHGGIVLFRPLSEDQAVERLRQAAKTAGVSLDEEAARWMVEEAGANWGILKAELEKMLLFARGKKLLTREDALACLGYRQASNPFDFPRVLQARELVRALVLLRRLLEEGTEPLRILYQIASTLTKQLKARRLAAAGVPEPQILRDLRLNAYYDKDFVRQAGKLNEAGLVAGLKNCLAAETALKSKTWLDPKTELERLVASFCK